MTICLLCLLVYPLSSMVAGEAGSDHEPPKSLTIMLPGDVPLEMRRIPAGTFSMGSPLDERGRQDDEPPAITVHISRDYMIGIHPVTQKQWVAIMGKNPSRFRGETRPVERVSWNDAQKFITRLNDHLVESGQDTISVRLPTEAEWEHACRAGTTTRFFFGDSLECADDVTDCEAEGMPGYRSDYMWWRGNSDGNTQPVGLLRPNPWGLYDMHGNVWEWCQDWWGGPPPAHGETDPSGPEYASRRSMRGGGWYSTAEFCRCATRTNSGYPNSRYSNTGFRLAGTIHR